MGARELLTVDEMIERLEELGTTSGQMMIESLTAMATWPRPIPVSERLPEDSGEVLCFGKKTKAGFEKWHAAYWDGGSWSCSVSDYTLNSVTHWLPLPPKPE